MVCESTQMNSDLKIAWIGRLTGPKGEIAAGLIDVVAPQLPEVSFTLAGVPLDHSLGTAWQTRLKNLPKNVMLVGFVKDVQSLLQSHDLILGSGRVALEALFEKRPLLAVGERIALGLIDEDNLEIAKASNFGDCASSGSGASEMSFIADEIARFAENPALFQPTHFPNLHESLSEYDGKYVHQKMMGIYRKSMLDVQLRRFKEIPVLTYHRVLQQEPSYSKFRIFITVEELEQQILSLKKRKFDVVTFHDLLNGKRVSKPILLTFDDGYADNYENLLPLLEKHNVKATIFALGNREIRRNEWDIALGEQPYPLMDDDHLLACHQSGLVEIGSHGLNHQHLTQLSEDALKREIFDSKEQLSDLLGETPISFSYPYGDYGEREKNAVKQAGYAFGVATVSGPLHFSADDFAIRRITMFPNKSKFDFWKKGSGWYLRYCKLRGKDF